jgi:hypothetical protein
MKKSLLFTMIALAGISASAADMTKEAFIERKKAQAKEAGREFDEVKDMNYFNKVDTNKDGVMSDAEVAAYKALPKKEAK